MEFKKKVIISVLCLFALVLVKPVHAQEVSPNPTPTPIEYALPYPGLLPDHPLYFLKAVRDRFMGFLISNPLKKAEFDLLQADKRVETSLILVKQGKNKTDLAVTTFSKGENYFEDAIAKTAEAKKEGLDINNFIKKLSLANRKHQEVLLDIDKKLNESEKKKFASERKRAELLGKKVKELGTH